MHEMCVRSLGWEDPLEKEMANQSGILVWVICGDRGVWWAIVCGVSKELDTNWQLNNNNNFNAMVSPIKI